jgi:two-component sensor histidine kinase
MIAMNEFNTQDQLPRITLRGVLILVAAYAAQAVAETVCLVAEVPEYRAASGEILARSLLDGGCKILMTLPLWWLIIRRFDGRPWPLRLAVHALALPAFLCGWHALYHGAVVLTGLMPVYEPSMPWDYYYGSIIYTAQFAIMHVIRQQRVARRREELTAELRHLANRAELKSLRAQVMPHFLFNTLHAISASVPAEQEELRRRITLLGGLLRYTLNTSERDRVTLGEELQFAKDYMELEKTRLGDRLTVTFDVDEEALQAIVPPVVLQPLVENALKHGVDNHRHGGEVTLSIQRHNGCAVVRVRDHAEGSHNPTPRGSGVGLRNIEARLQGLGNGARLNTQQLASGFEAEIAVPMAQE